MTEPNPAAADPPVLPALAQPEASSDQPAAAGPQAEVRSEPSSSSAASQHSYFAALPETIRLTEHNRPTYDRFATAMHAIEAPPEIVHKALEFHQAHEAEVARAFQVADAEDVKTVSAALREKWGEQYTGNVAALKQYIKGLPAIVQQAFARTRLDDGRAFMNTPEGAQWMLSLATASVAPGTRSADEELAAIEKTMRDNRPLYDRDLSMQARARELYAQRQGSSAPQIPSDVKGINAEILKLEKLMREDRQAYNRDEAAQTKLRALYAVREQLQQPA